MPTLLPVEKEALSQAISEEFLRVQGWQIDTKNWQGYFYKGRTAYLHRRFCHSYQESARLLR